MAGMDFTTHHQISLVIVTVFSRWSRNHLHSAIQPVVHVYREDFPQHALKV
jgi:hypothetical protein